MYNGCKNLQFEAIFLKGQNVFKFFSSDKNFAEKSLEYIVRLIKTTIWKRKILNFEMIYALKAKLKMSFAFLKRWSSKR